LCGYIVLRVEFQEGRRASLLCHTTREVQRVELVRWKGCRGRLPLSLSNLSIWEVWGQLLLRHVLVGVEGETILALRESCRVANL